MPYIDFLKIPKGETRLLSRNRNSFDVGRVMKNMVSQSAKSGTIKEFVKRHPMNEKQVFDYAYMKASFKPDKGKKQVIKTPMATIRSMRANCVCYSVLIATLLKANRIPGKFRLVNFKSGKMPGHVYIVTDSGKVLDCVLGQPQDREISRKDRKNKTGRFNEETESFAKFDVQY